MDIPFHGPSLGWKRDLFLEATQRTNGFQVCVRIYIVFNVHSDYNQYIYICVYIFLIYIFERQPCQRFGPQIQRSAGDDLFLISKIIFSEKYIYIYIYTHLYIYIFVLFFG